jgi:hypothetical protein
MSRTYKDSRKRGYAKPRHISVRGVRRNPPDLQKLSRALIQLALEQADAEAAARQQPKKPESTTPEVKHD